MWSKNPSFSSYESATWLITAYRATPILTPPKPLALA